MSIYPYNVDKHDDTSSGGCGSEEPAMSSYEMFLASFSSSILGVNSFAIAEPVRPWGGLVLMRRQITARMSTATHANKPPCVYHGSKLINSLFMPGRCAFTNNY